jgi:hypothetical protein
MSKTPLKDFTDAAKLDILNILSAEKPAVFEFRRVQDIAQQMVDFVNSYGTPVEHGAFVQAINMAESKSPNLHDVFLGRAFDGHGLLVQKYEQMLREHTELRHAALNIAEANEVIRRDRAEVESEKEELKATHRKLAIERERLQLSADAAGKQVNLPTLPRLTRPEEVGDEGGEIDLNKVKPRPGRRGVSRGDDE